MISRLSAAAHRRRAPLLLAAVAVTALVTGSVRLGLAAEPAAAVLGAMGLVFLVLGLIVVVTVLRPGLARAAFVVDERTPALRTPRAGTLPLLTVTMLAVLGVVLVVPASETDLRPMVWSLAAVCVVFLAVCARATLIGIGLTISSEGLRADKFTGSVIVPWAAIDPDRIGCGPFEVHLRYRDPKLITTTGWVVNTGKLRVDGVTPEFAAATIHHYAGAPEQRVLIGTPPGQLHPGTRIVLMPATPPLGRTGALVVVLTLAVLVGIGAVAGDLAVGSAYGNASAAGIVAHVVTVASVLLALRFIRGAVTLIRRPD
jgi:hypothetical protein